MQIEENTLVVRRVNRRVYKRFRQKALDEETNMGEAVTEAMEYWIEAKQRKKRINVKNLLKLNALIKTGKKVNWSTDIDKILYGGRN
jgi:hypothetical protein